MKFNETQTRNTRARSSCSFPNVMMQRRFVFLMLFCLSFFLGACARQAQLTEEKTQLASNLPLFVITTEQDIPDEPKITAHLGVIANEGENNLGDAFNAYNGSIGIEIRGSSSQLYPKKQYGFETRDETGEDLNVSLLGLPEENDWILYAPYSDKSLIRNALVYETARAMGQYASRHVFVELYLNDDYMGVYVLLEKIKRDKNRVDISKNKDDLTGGYLLELESSLRFEDDDVYILSERFRDKAFFFDYPKADDVSSEQKNYMQSYLNDFEAALYGDDFTHPSKGYAAFIDRASFIDFILLNDLVKNRDAFFRSTFIYKDKQDLLHLGPVWDYNIALGNDEAKVGAAEGFLSEDYDLYWAERLMEDPAFVDALIARYWTLREGAWSNKSFEDRISSMTDELNQAQIRNFNRWPILSKYVWPNRYMGESYEQEINYLNLWLQQRLEWLDRNIDSLAVESE